MTRKVLMLLAVFSASAVLGGTFPGTTATGAAAAPGATGPREWTKLLLQPADGRRGDFRPATVDRESLVTVMLEMAGEPVAKAQAAAADEGTVLSEDARAQLRSELRERQEPVRRGVEALGGQVVAETQDAFNGVKVRVPRAQLGAVGGLPGVVAVLEVPTVERSAEESVPFLGVPKKVWQDLGLTGKDVSIGVVDTGIDYTHADFGGPGTAEAYRANDPRVVEPRTFPTAKVVGGWDFVGDDYNSAARPGDPALVRRPDGDPLDCNGHGTHVAGTAAGMGVLAGGSTYAGPYDASTYEHDFGVGPGVAPQASLYALKIFGCSGSSDAMVEAINWAVAHDLDVVNLSLGTPFGALGGAEVEALDNAARAGVVPVVSAGNEGDVTYIVGSPGTAERAISVAAVESVEGYPLADVTVGDATSRARNLNFGDLSEPVTGRLYAVEDDPSTRADESLGCVRSDYAKVPAGSVAVVNRGECALLVRAQLGQSAGAAAVVIVSNVAEAPPFIGGVEGATIPLLGVTPSHGSELRADAGRVATITANGMTPNLNYRGPAPFTSSGPALGGDLAKPDVAAPGFLIVSAGMGTGSGPSTLSGTSMAAPHVAGIAALVREARPSDSVETVKAAIVNTADPGGTTRYSTVRLGAGLVDPAEAVRTPVVALGDRGTASLSFGYAESVGRVSETKTVTLRNTGRQPVMFGASVEESSTPQGTATVTVSPRSVNVGAGREAKVRVTVTVTSSAGLPSSAFQAASGTILFTPRGAGANSLRVPYLLVHRAVSEVDTSPDAVRQPSRGTVDFRTRNGSPVAGSANVFAWGLSDPQGDDVVRGGRAPDIRAVGVQALPEEGMGVFAVNAYERLGTASAAEYDVLLDVDEDGSADFVVVGTDLGLVTAGAANGTFASVVFDLSSGSAVSAYLASGAISSSTVLLPFAFRDVGISEANPDFTYDAASYSVFAAGADEVKGPALFNVFSQPVQTGQYLELRGRSSASWTAALNRQQLQKTPAKGWMVVSLQNRAGPDQAELIELR